MVYFSRQPNRYHGIVHCTWLASHLCSVVLRRRIPLKKNILQKVIMTPHADSILSLVCSSSQPLPTPKKDHWIEDKQATHCPVTGKKFGLFVRRHHCRISGGIYSEEVCNFRQLDLAYHIYCRLTFFAGNYYQISGTTKALRELLMLSLDWKVSIFQKIS